MRRVSGLIWIAIWFCLASLLAACGDDDDDQQNENDDDFDLDDDDDDQPDDDDQAGGDCADFAANFYGPEGCLPDSNAYQSTLDMCAQIAELGTDALTQFVECLTAIDCSDYSDFADLYTATAECMAPLINSSS